MHKQVVVSGDEATIVRLAHELPLLDGVIGLSLERNGSIKPPGHALTVHVLNQTADEVLRRCADAVRAGQVQLVLSEVSAFITVREKERIACDDDEAQWEELESQLRNHGRISINYILLMVLGGAVSAGAFTVDPVSQAIALVGASITSPGFEPLAKVCQGVVLRRRGMVGHGALSTLVGYSALVISAFLTALMLRSIDQLRPEALRAEPIAHALSSFEAHSLLPSVCAAIAGGLMVASLRDSYVVGPLMVLALIPAAALIGVAGAIGELELAARAAARAALDAATVLILVSLVFFWKQRTKHRRSLLP